MVDFFGNVHSNNQSLIVDLQNLLVLCTLHVETLPNRYLCLPSSDKHNAIVLREVSFFKVHPYSLQECFFIFALETTMVTTLGPETPVFSGFLDLISS